MDTCRTIREIRRDMHKQREWRNELEKMKIGNVVGSLSVESKTLRANLIPITQRTLEQVSHLQLLHTIYAGAFLLSCISAQAIESHLALFLVSPVFAKGTHPILISTEFVFACCKHVPACRALP